MKQGKGVRLFFLSLFFLLGLSELVQLFGSWSPQDGQVITLQLVLFGLVIVAWLLSIIMEIIGLGKWTWVVYLILLPVTFANVIGLHLDDNLGLLNVQDSNYIDSLGIIEATDRPFIFAYMTLFVDIILLINSWHQRNSTGMSDDAKVKSQELSS